MATEKIRIAGLQNTGNPVLDSLVNIVISAPGLLDLPNDLKSVHELLIELAGKEPGGLRRWNGMSEA